MQIAVGFLTIFTPPPPPPWQHVPSLFVNTMAGDDRFLLQPNSSFKVNLPFNVAEDIQLKQRDSVSKIKEYLSR
jgi:hypothetical protein